MGLAACILKLLTLLLSTFGFIAANFMTQETFDLVRLIACPSNMLPARSKLACSQSCLTTSDCNGFVWRSDNKQCKLVKLLLATTSAGPCGYYMRRHVKRASERCPGYDIAVPSSPDRVYRLFKDKKQPDNVEGVCNAAGGVTAEMERGQSMGEMFKFMGEVVFQDSSWFPKCAWFASDNIQ